MFAVWAAVAKDESDFVGCCYLDLFPHGISPCVLYLYFLDVHITDLTTSLESKYSQSAIWGLLPGYIRPDGKRTYPLVRWLPT